MDRKQQLGAMGMACWEAWEGRMRALQALPAMPVTALHDSLPTYRAWIGALAQMHRSWMDVTDDSSALLDPMLPWHWLEVGLGEWGQPSDATTQQALEQPTMRGVAPAVQPPAPQPKQESPLQHKERQQPAPRLQHIPAQQLPQEALQQTASPQSPLAAATDDLQGGGKEQPQNRPTQQPVGKQKSAENPQPSKETPATNWPFEARPAQEPAKQVIFRGLDDFAAFVQSPIPPAQLAKETAASAQFTGAAELETDASEVELKTQPSIIDAPPQTLSEIERLQHSLFDQLEDAFTALQPVAPTLQPVTQPHFPERGQREMMAGSWPTMEGAVQPSQLEGLERNITPAMQGEEQLKSHNSTAQGPAFVQHNINPGEDLIPSLQQPNPLVSAAHPEVSQERQNLAPQAVAKGKAESLQALAIPNWEQVEAQWEQFAAVPTGKGKQRRQAPTLRKPAAVANARTAQAAPTLAAANQSLPVAPLQSTPQREPESATQTPAEVQPMALPIWPAKQEAALPQQDATRLVEEFMELMTDQLQRDFKRFYGA